MINKFIYRNEEEGVVYISEGGTNAQEWLIIIKIIYKDRSRKQNTVKSGVNSLLLYPTFINNHVLIE